MSSGDRNNFDNFDDAANFDVESNPTEEQEAIPHPSPTEPDEPAGATPPPRPPEPEPEPAPPGKRTAPALWLLLAALVLSVLGAGYWFTMGPGAQTDDTPVGLTSTQPADVEAPPAGSTTAPLAGESPPAPAPAQPGSEASSAELDALSAEVQSLSAQLAAVEKRLTAMPEPGAAADLKPLQERLNRLDDLPDRVESLSKQVAALSERVATVEDSVATVRKEIEVVQEQARTPAEPKAEAPAANAALAGAELDRAGNLLVKQQYAEAQKILADLREKFPDDARVWYASALANGFATGTWDGQTVQFAQRGAERERAGTPDKAEIDRIFADIRPETRTWLDYYRP